MTGFDLLLLVVILLCFWLGTKSSPEKKKETKSAEKEFAEALEKLLSAGIRVIEKDKE